MSRRDRSRCARLSWKAGNRAGSTYCLRPLPIHPAHQGLRVAVIHGLTHFEDPATPNLFTMRGLCFSRACVRRIHVSGSGRHRPRQLPS